MHSSSSLQTACWQTAKKAHASEVTVNVKIEPWVEKVESSVYKLLSVQHEDLSFTPRAHVKGRHTLEIPALGK